MVEAEEVGSDLHIMIIMEIVTARREITTIVMDHHHLIINQCHTIMIDTLGIWETIHNRFF